MKRKKHQREQIMLREADTILAASQTIVQVVQALEIGEQTFPSLTEPVRQREG